MPDIKRTQNIPTIINAYVDKCDLKLDTRVSKKCLL